MNILHYGCNYLPNVGGNVIRMQRVLEKEGGSEDKVCVYVMENHKYDFDDEVYFKRTGIRIIRFKDREDARRNLKSVVRGNDIEIVVTHTYSSNFLACRVLPKDVLIVSEIHSLMQSSSLVMLKKKLVHRFFLNRRNSKYFVLSKGASEYIIREYGVREEDIVFVPNGRVENYSELRPGNRKHFTFAYVGTFYSWQGLDIIVANIDKVLDIDERIRIYLIGNGDGYYDELLKLSEQEKYQNRLILTDKVSHDRLHLHMDEIDVLMAPRPSSLETETAIPLKIFEGAEFGKVLLISNVSGLTEVFDESEAFVFDPKDSAGFLNACKEAFENQKVMADKYARSLEKLDKWPLWSEIQGRQSEALKKLLNK